MSTPRFYSWDDAGSPGRALTGNLQNKLKQILIPCLVTGYGDKPGAGWTIGHEHPNGFSLINAEGNVVNFVSELSAQSPYPAMNTYAVHIYAAESLTDTSGAIIDGASLCSGSFRKGIPETSGYPRHMLGEIIYLFAAELSTLQWVLVADSTSFTLNCSSIGSNPTRQLYTYSFTLYAGAIQLDVPVSGNFLVLGGDIAAYTSKSYMFPFCRGFSSPTNLGTGLAQHAVVGAEPYASAGSGDPINKSSKSMSRLNLQSPRVRYDNGFLGTLRGVVYDDVLRALFGWEEHLKVLGFSGEDFNDRGKTVLIDGYNYAFARSGYGNSILTDNPAFW